jgi:hypothetical protein
MKRGDTYGKWIRPILKRCINYTRILWTSLDERWILKKDVATPLWPSVGVKPNTPKVGDLESSGTPECLEFDNKAQNAAHWGVPCVIRKVLKCRYRKWPCIGHLDIYSPSYGQKKGRESAWQFDSRKQKVGNRPLPDVRIECATRHWSRCKGCCIVSYFIGCEQDVEIAKDYDKKIVSYVP